MSKTSRVDAVGRTVRALILLAALAGFLPGVAFAEKVAVYVDFGGFSTAPTNHAAFLAEVQGHFDSAGIGQGNDPGVVILDSTNTAPLTAPPFLTGATLRVTFVCDPTIFAYGRAFPTNHSAVINLYAFVFMDFPGPSNEVRRAAALAETIAHEVGHLLDAVHDCGNGGGLKEDVIEGEVTVTNFVACTAGPATLLTVGTCVSNSFRGLSLRAFGADTVTDIKNCIAGLSAVPPLPCTKFINSGDPLGNEDGFLRAIQGRRYTNVLLAGASAPLRQEDDNLTLDYDVLSGDGGLFELGWLTRSGQFVSLTGAQTNQHGTVETTGGTAMLFALRGRAWTPFAGQVFSHKDFATVTLSGRTNTPANAATPGVRTNYFSQATLSFSVSNTVFAVRLNAGAWSGDNGFYRVNTAAQPEPPTTALVTRGSVWSYLANGTDPGPNWMMPAYNDASWSGGPAELGFNDNPVTVINTNPAVNRFITYYFRRSFTVANATSYSNLLVRLQRDDGAVVYLNGTEIWRSGMPAGPVTTGTLAVASVDNAAESTFFETNSTSAAQALSNGVNVVAVEVHQATTGSSEDLSFDLEMIGNVPPDNARPVVFLSTPANNTTVEAGQNVVLSVSTGDAADPDGTITRVDFLGGNFPAADFSPPFSVVWSNPPPGSYSLSALAYDDFGATTISTNPVYLTVVSNRAPEAVISTPGDGRTLFATGGTVSVTIAATAWDTLPSGQAVNPASVEFYTNGVLAATDTTSPYSTAVTLSLSQPATYTLRAVAQDTLGARGTSAPVSVVVTSAPVSTVSLIATGTPWGYRQDCVDPYPDWLQVTYDDTSWPSGPSPLGTDATEATVLVYQFSASVARFRHTFNVSNPATLSSLQFRTLMDDGGIVYLNGVQAFTVNTTNTSGNCPSSGAQSSVTVRSFVTNTVSPALLQAGSNVVAVDLHQYYFDSQNDFSFNLELTGQTTASTPFAITRAPVSHTNSLGGTATFSIGVASSQPVTYQWYRTDLGALSGRVSPVLLLTNLQPTDADTLYYATASNGSGSVTSSVVALRLRPAVLTQPQDLRVALNGAATFSASAAGSTNLGYSWQRGGTNLVPPATNTTLFIPIAGTNSVGLYYLVATNLYGSATSRVATLSVVTPPNIVLPPLDRTNSVSSTAIFTVQASGTAPLNYQWQRNGISLPGALGPTLSLFSVQPADGGTNQYRAIVSNLAGNATSAVARLTIITPPVITSQPVGQRVTPGDTATFQVSATGSQLGYQWYRAPNTPLAGANTPTLTLSNVASAQAEYYFVIVANPVCPVESERAFLEVLEAREMYYPTNRLPPHKSSYHEVDEFHAQYTNGLMIVSNGNHTSFTTNLPPPVSGLQEHSFGSRVEGNFSMAGSPSGLFVSAPADVLTRVTYLGQQGGRSIYSNQMAALNATNGGLANGVALRIAPSHVSAGTTTIRPAGGGYLISSAFTLYTEATTDFGQSWSPSLAPTHVELSPDPPEDDYSNGNLPPYDGAYVSPVEYHLNLAMGIVVSNISHRAFTRNAPPPPLGTNRIHAFGSLVDFDLSLNNGASFTHVSAPAATHVSVTHDRDPATNSAHFETEMLQLDISGGNLPAGMIIRKDPARPGRGETTRTNTVGGARLSSYFDIPLQVSTDNGVTWFSANRPARVQLSSLPPARLTATRAGTNLFLDWPASFGECGLESATSIGPGALWTTETNRPTYQYDSLNRLVVPLDDQRKFFRLNQPTPIGDNVTVETVPIVTELGVLQQIKVTVPGPCRVTVTFKTFAGTRLLQNSGGPSGGASTVVTVPAGTEGVLLDDFDRLTVTIDCPCAQHEVRDYIFRNGQFEEVF